MNTPNLKYISHKVPKETNKDLSKIYDVHKYWSRKPWYSIRECIKKYSKERDTVLDMFLGSGVTALESISLGRDFIGFDLNPMSIFISKSTILNHFDEAIFNKELDIIGKKLFPLVIDLYGVKDKCQICNKNMIIKHLNLGPAFVGKETVSIYCMNCGKKTKLTRRATKEEVNKSKESYNINKWVPKSEFPSKFYKDRFSYKGVRKVIDLYTSRNLFFLSELLHSIKNSNLKYKKLFLLAFSNTVLHASKLKGENVRPLNVNNYWIPDDYFEENPWLRFLERVELIVEGKKALQKKIENNKLGKFKLYNRSCLSTALKDNSVDYVITDPPYGDAVQYSELSFVWNSWMGFKYKIEEEIVINPVQNKGIKEFLELFDKSVAEASRVLKNGNRYTLCFHNKEISIWKGVLDIFKKHDFMLEQIEIVDTNGNSYNKNWAKFSPKTDFYITFIKRKYKPTHYSEFSVQEFLRSILQKNKTNNPAKIYDELSVRLIYELYFNKFQVNISNLNIRKIGEFMEMTKSGD